MKIDEQEAYMKQNVLLTPGPLTTSLETKKAMMVDMGTRDGDYQSLIQDLREKLLSLGHGDKKEYAVVFMQGSGTFGVESVLTSVVAKDSKVLILSNGAYGNRMAKICKKAKVPFEEVNFSMIEELKQEEIEPLIAKTEFTHVAYVHCETTAGILNNITMIQQLICKYQKISIVDAMSSFASVDINITDLNIDYLITSSNKCLHGVPGAAIIFAKRSQLETCENISDSLSLDLYEQYRYMEDQPGSFRFTSPTHVLLALHHAVEELLETGGIQQRNQRYHKIQDQIHQAMSEAGFISLLPKAIQSPVITTYLYPENFDFSQFYDYFKEHGFLLYSGKLPQYDAFRIGNIGEISDEDVTRFIQLLKKWEDRK